MFSTYQPVITSGGGGGVSGSGTAGQAAFWSGASALSGNANFLWDNAAKTLTLQGTGTGKAIFGPWETSTAYFAIGLTNDLTAANLVGMFSSPGDPNLYLNIKTNQNFIFRNGETQIAIFTAAKNFGLNADAFGANANTVLGIKNGVAPTTSPADTIQLWAEDVAASSELRVRDEAGNVTTLSPHNFTLFTPDPAAAFPWSYYSRNDHLGLEINVDLYQAIKDLETVTGKKYIYTNPVPKAEWTANQEENRVQREQAIAKWNKKKAAADAQGVAFTEPQPKPYTPKLAPVWMRARGVQ